MDPLSATPSIFCAGLYLNLERGLGFTQARANTYTLFATLVMQTFVLYVIHEVSLKASVLGGDDLYHLHKWRGKMRTFFCKALLKTELKGLRSLPKVTPKKEKENEKQSWSGCQSTDSQSRELTFAFTFCLEAGEINSSAPSSLQQEPEVSVLPGDNSKFLCTLYFIFRITHTQD